MNFMIAFTVSLMGCCVTLPLYFRYGYHSNYSSFLLIISLFIACMPVLAVPDNIDILGKYYLPIQRFCYFIFITAVILFGLTIVRDIIWILASITFKTVPSPLNPIYLHKINLITFVFSFLCSCYALYAGSITPQIKEQEIYTDKVNHKQKIIVLSDLHLTRVVKPEKIKNIVESVNQQKPDVILLVGDIIDDEATYTKPLLDILQHLTATKGIFYVSGNHEFYIGYNTSMQLIREYNFTPLENNGIQIDSVFIGGIPDIYASNRFGKLVDIKTTFKQAKKNSYQILMSHTPIKLPKETNIDLIVSGHTHGGQIFPFHIFSWTYNKGLLAGLYRVEKDKYIYVSRGSGQWGPQMRFGAPSEISVLNILPK